MNSLWCHERCQQQQFRSCDILFWFYTLGRNQDIANGVHFCIKYYKPYQISNFNPEKVRPLLEFLFRGPPEISLIYLIDYSEKRRQFCY